MKKFLLALVLMGGFSFAVDIACVNTEKIVRESKFIAKAQMELRRELEKYQRQITEKQKKLETLKKEVEQGILSEQAKKKKTKQIEALEEELRKLQIEAQAKLTKKKGELEKMVFNRVIEVVENIAQKSNFKAVFDCATMLYYNPQIDITSEVLRELDKTK